MSRSPPGMTTLHMDSGSEYCRFDSYVLLYDTVNIFGISLLEYSNLKIVESSGEATCQPKRIGVCCSASKQAAVR